MKLKPVQVPPRPKNLRVEALALLEPRFEVRAAEGRIEVFDQIGGDGVTPAKISAALRAIGNQRVTVAINSPGGSFYDGLTIYNLLVGHAPGVTTEVLGIAASAAALVAVAGETVRMAKASQLMIHRATGGVLGNAQAMRQVADVLDKVDQTMIGIFTARTGLDVETVTATLDQETFLNSDEALAYGFADGLLEVDAIAAPVTANATMPTSKRELEEQFRRLGFSRSVAAKMTGAAWAARGSSGAELDSEAEIDLSAIADAVTRNVAAIAPSRSR